LHDPKVTSSFMYFFDFFHTKLSAGGLDGLGMREEFLLQFFWFSISLIVFFVARKKYRKINDRASLILMLIALVSLVIFFIYGMIGMYLGFGPRVVPGMRGFRSDISSISFIVRGLLAVIIAAIAYNVFKKSRK
jgi:putative effector of murein hydrolase